ncbi:MAG: hypothetical protein PHR52_11695 [Fermentimonas sp.]|nr:hypothetical protein [Fermentimonas sp.]MDD4698185.1 hypothetical protein [Fermentimonas sp.]
MKTKCITFDKQAQDALPEEIKAKMKADREKARRDMQLKEMEAISIIKINSTIETNIGETITTVSMDKSKLRHKAVKDTDLRYACDYCSLRNLDCSLLLCSRDERSDAQDIHYELI